MVGESKAAASVVRSWWLWPAVYGAAVFAAIHVMLVAYWKDIVIEGDEQAPWWLNSGQSILLSEGALVIAASLAALWRSSAPWRTALAMVGGVMASATGILFSIGAGT